LKGVALQEDLGDDLDARPMPSDKHPRLVTQVVSRRVIDLVAQGYVGGLCLVVINIVLAERGVRSKLDLSRRTRKANDDLVIGSPLFVIGRHSFALGVLVRNDGDEANVVAEPPGYHHVPGFVVGDCFPRCHAVLKSRPRSLTGLIFHFC
jgi:hypothetical protein